MDRKAFLRTLPGLFAVKEIAKHLATLPAQNPIATTNIEYASQGIYAMIRQGNRVTYNTGNFSIAMFKEVFEKLYTDKPLEDRQIIIQTNERGILEIEKALNPSLWNRLRIGYFSLFRRSA